MKDFFVTVLSLVIILVTLLWIMIICLGGAEILWWIFTGDFFHFVSETAVSTW